MSGGMVDTTDDGSWISAEPFQRTWNVIAHGRQRETRCWCAGGNDQFALTSTSLSFLLIGCASVTATLGLDKVRVVRQTLKSDEEQMMVSLMMPAGLEANIATVICRMVSNVPCLIVVDRHRRGGRDRRGRAGLLFVMGYNVLQPSIVALGKGERRGNKQYDLDPTGGRR
ncbi:MAG: hypothetical protein J3Q66DRAFT_324796 [Benniella sp.]|nr:MAG: hypothetical protein J3Q66DRAFT_324796 [Benniella sp.]